MDELAAASIQAITTAAEKLKIEPLALAERLASGEIADLVFELQILLSLAREERDREDIRALVDRIKRGRS